MSAANNTIHARLPSRRQEYDSTLRQSALKRKLSTFVAPSRPDETSYPSPPMSSPPSPSRTQPEHSLSGSRTLALTSISQQDTLPAFTSGPARTSSPVPSLLPHAFAAYQPTIAPPTTIQQTTHHVQALQPAGRPLQPGLQVAPLSGLDSAVAATQTSLPTSNLAGTPPTRGGRKAKSHVASACINCKRAHLSCDVQRPCSRCVSTGKQDTCFDVQHKKRGRPRLREEGEFKVDQMLPEQAAQSASHASPTQTPSRPIAGVRHRRGESYRSLLSQTSDDSPIWSATTPSHASSAMLQSPFSYQHPPMHSSSRSTYELATALLDLDFIVLRANRPFEQIVAGGQGLRGRHISDIVGPADTESFDTIRHSLRAEREAREPAHMPPILQPGQDPLQGVSESDVDQFTESFSDRTYTWTQTQLGSAAQTFPARVRLAKAGSYFVVITLPSFRPVDPPPLQLPVSSYGAPLLVGSPLPAPESYTPSRPFELLSTPRTAHAQFIPTTLASQRPPPAAQQYSTQAYPPPSHYPHSFQHLPTPQTPRLPIAEPPTDTTAFTPRSVLRETVRLTGTGELQLPPIGDTSGATSRSRATTMDSIIQHASSDDGEGEESPRKRRRLGIDDVLHR